MYLPSEEKATDRMSLAWPLRMFLVLKELRSHSLTVLSHEPEMTNLLSALMSREETKWLCPERDLKGLPMVFSSVSLLSEMTGSGFFRLSFQTMSLLSLPPDTTSGSPLESLPMTMEVTVPLWP